jgi:hypothetical protein
MYGIDEVCLTNFEIEYFGIFSVKGRLSEKEILNYHKAKIFHESLTASFWTKLFIVLISKQRKNPRPFTLLQAKKNLFTVHKRSCDDPYAQFAFLL